MIIYTYPFNYRLVILETTIIIIIFWQAGLKFEPIFYTKGRDHGESTLDNVKPEVFIAAALVFHSHKRDVEWTGIKQDRLHSVWHVSLTDCLRKLIWQEKKVSFSSGVKMMLGASAKCFTWSLRQKRIDLYVVFESILELGTKLVGAEAHRPCLDDAITSNMVWDLLRWFSPEVLYLVTLTNCWKPNSHCVCSRFGTWRRWRIFTCKTLSKGHAVGLAGRTFFKVTKVEFVGQLWDVRKIAGRTRYLNETRDHIDHFPRIRVQEVFNLRWMLESAVRWNGTNHLILSKIWFEIDPPSKS